MLKLDSIIFSNPRCTYSSQSLGHDLIYVPSKDKDCKEKHHIPCIFLNHMEDPDSSQPHDQNKKGKILIYFHGNAEDLGVAYLWLYLLRDVLGVRILGVEYRGYGLFGGKPKDSEGLLNDCLAVYDFVNNQMGMQESDIILVGRSLGASPACFIGSKRNPAAIVLISPYLTLQEAAKAVAGRILGSLVQNRFDNQAMIKEVTSPVFIVHGQKDELIPHQQSEKLIESCINSKGTSLILPPNMTHNQFNMEHDLIRPLLGFLSTLKIKLTAKKQIDNCALVKEKYCAKPHPPRDIMEFEQTIFQVQYSQQPNTSRNEFDKSLDKDQIYLP